MFQSAAVVPSGPYADTVAYANFVDDSGLGTPDKLREWQRKGGKYMLYVEKQIEELVGGGRTCREDVVTWEETWEEACGNRTLGTRWAIIGREGACEIHVEAKARAGVRMRGISLECAYGRGGGANVCKHVCLWKRLCTDVCVCV